MMMMGKPILGCAFLIMLLVVSVTAESCKCNKNKQLFESTAGCKAELECIKKSPACLKDKGSQRLVKFLEHQKCSDKALCFFDVYGQVEPDALDTVKLDKENVLDILSQKHSCLKQLFKKDNRCKNKASAEKCFYSVSESKACAGILLKNCETANVSYAIDHLRKL